MPTSDPIWPPPIQTENVPAGQLYGRPFTRACKFAAAGALYGVVFGGLYGTSLSLKPAPEADDGFEMILFGLAGCFFGILGGAITGIVISFMTNRSKFWGVTAAILAPFCPGIVLVLVPSRFTDGINFYFVYPMMIAFTVATAWAWDYGRERPFLPLIRWLKT